LLAKDFPTLRGFAVHDRHPPERVPSVPLYHGRYVPYEIFM
jgi:hypothetical protein